MIFSAAPHIDWSSHLGGVIFGFAITAALFARELADPKLKLIVTIAGWGSIIVFYAIGLGLFFTLDKYTH